MSVADHDARIVELHRRGLSPQQIAAELADDETEIEPGAVQERLIWLLMPKAHSSA